MFPFLCFRSHVFVLMFPFWCLETGPETQTPLICEDDQEKYKKAVLKISLAQFLLQLFKNEPKLASYDKNTCTYMYTSSKILIIYV